MFSRKRILCYLGAAAAALTAGLAQADYPESNNNYVLVDNFNSSNFFDSFDFFTAGDPTQGFVKYVDAATANRDHLAGYSQGGVYLGVDHTNQYNSSIKNNGRPSVRLSSKKTWTRGLFVADIAHMPAGKTDNGSCGLWPAFWTLGLGQDWPLAGEIDIIENVNTAQSNAVTLHTGQSCNVTNEGSLATTNLVSGSCEGNIGCKQDTNGRDNYGARFNAAGGGVYVIEWTDDAISAWFFSHGRPADMPAALSTTTASSSSSSSSSSSKRDDNTQSTTQTHLDTSTLGQPLAVFRAGASCSIADNFSNHTIVINTDFCGQWAGKVWGQDPTCAKLGNSCDAYVGDNPQAFEDAYWLFKSIKVYQIADNGTSTGGTGGGGSSKKRFEDAKGRMARGLPFIA